MWLNQFNAWLVTLLTGLPKERIPQIQNQNVNACKAIREMKTVCASIFNAKKAGCLLKENASNMIQHVQRVQQRETVEFVNAQLFTRWSIFNANWLLAKQMRNSTMAFVFLKQFAQMDSQ